jgi:hypothetical protein
MPPGKSGTASATARNAGGATHQIDFPCRFDHAHLAHQQTDIHTLLLGKGSS